MSMFRLKLGLLFLALCVAFGLSPAYASVARKPVLSADLRTRTLVRGISARQVAFLQFSDLLYGGEAVNPYDPSGGPEPHPAFLPTVTDPRLIGRFLAALRGASKPIGPQPAILWPTMEIHFRRSGAHPRPPVNIDFNSEYFGPQFAAVLNTLPGYLAARLRREVRSAAPQVRRVEFAGIKVTDTAEAARIVQAMERIDRRAFDLSASPYEDTFEVKLLLNGPRSLDAVFAGKSPLPGILQDYRWRVQRGGSLRR